MKNADPFDAWLDMKSVQAKTSVARSAPYVRDMLKCSWTAAQSVFGKAAKPEHAVMLLPHFLAAADVERQLLQAEIGVQTAGGAKPPRKRPAAR